MTVMNSSEDAFLPAIKAGQLAGAAALIWRNGSIREVATVGRRDLVYGAPVERGTIFRIASMTKPVTTVAALTLLDEGRFELDEPIATCAPEFSRVRVLRDPDGPLDQTDEAPRPITFRDLLTHRSGLTYGDLHRGPIGRAYVESLGATIDNPLTPDAWIARLATLPLIDQPGARFHYSHSTDLLGFLIARLDAGHGYGMGVAVVMEPEKADPLRCRGGVGTVGWPGAYGGWWQADPNDGSVLIFLAHNMVELHQMARGIGLDVWSAIATFHSHGSAAL